MKLAEARRVLKWWSENPSAYAEHALGVHLWGKQREILQALRTDRRVAVASGHNIGKTFLAAVAAQWFFDSHIGARVITTAPTSSAVRENLWGEIRKTRRRALVPLGGELLDQAPVLRHDNEGWSIIGIAAGSGDAFQGKHERNILIVLDEAQGVRRDIWEASESMMGSENARMLAICNPLHGEGEARACFFGNRASWRTFNVSCLEHPNIEAERLGLPKPYPSAVSLEWCESIRQRWGESSAYYRARVLGQWSDSAGDAVIPLSFLEAASKAGQTNVKEPRHMGVDVARFGDDSNVACVTKDRRVEFVEVWDGVDTMKTAGKVRHLAKVHGIRPENVHVDVIGVGGGVVDRLAEEGFVVDAVNFGGGPENDWQSVTGDTAFKNRRAELYFALRLLLQERAFIIGEQHAEAWSELSSISYSFDAGDRVVIEPKDKVKERLGRSPDHADAVVLSLSRTGAGAQVFVL